MALLQELRRQQRRAGIFTISFPPLRSSGRSSARLRRFGSPLQGHRRRRRRRHFIRLVWSTVRPSGYCLSQSRGSPPSSFPPHIALLSCSSLLDDARPASTKTIFVAMHACCTHACHTILLPVQNSKVGCKLARCPLAFALQSNPSNCPTTTTPPSPRPPSVRCVSRLLHCTSARRRTK